jgi:hypothetical protein
VIESALLEVRVFPWRPRQPLVLCRVPAGHRPGFPVRWAWS